MKDEQIKHLEFIQSTIAHLRQNSFAYKGWAITVVVAILALFAKEDHSGQRLLIGLLPTAAFWGLDAFYLHRECLFRELYDAVRLMEQDQWEKNPFCMDTRPFRGRTRCWWCILFSSSIVWVYVPLMAVILTASFICRCSI